MSDYKDNVAVPKNLINKIICGDSSEVLTTIPDNCIDLILTSPPYNFDMGYDTFEDNTEWQKYYDFLINILNECMRVLKWGGRLVINIQPNFSQYHPTHHYISNMILSNKDMIWKGEIIWDKHNFGCSTTTWGSWKSPSAPYIRYTNEFIEVYCKGDIKHIGNSDKSDMTNEQFINWTRNYWSMAPETRMKEFNHPAMFPEELAMRCIRLFSFQDDVILDPFNGCGTTTYVAKKFKRNYIGIEISDTYCDVAKKRLKFRTLI